MCSLIEGILGDVMSPRGAKYTIFEVSHPKLFTGMVFGTGNLQYWVLGLSGSRKCALCVFRHYFRYTFEARRAAASLSFKAGKSSYVRTVHRTHNSVAVQKSMSMSISKMALLSLP